MHYLGAWVDALMVVDRWKGKKPIIDSDGGGNNQKKI